MTTQPASGIPAWTIGDRLKKARLRLGLDQGPFADLIGVSRNSVISYEADKTRPKRPVLRAWADETHVPVSWLEDGTDPGPGSTGGGLRVARKPAGSRHGDLTSLYAHSTEEQYAAEAA